MTTLKRTPYPFDPHAISIARRQYFQPGDGTVAGMFARVAAWVAQAEPEAERERWQERFLELMLSGRFCPGGRVLAGAGTKHGNVLNCFVQGATEHPPGSFLGVMEVARKLALVTKVGGGNGVNLDPYPPKQAARKGGLWVRGWAYLRADHPDAKDFVLGRMRPPALPEGEKVAAHTHNFSKVLYGPVSPELAALARSQGVLVERDLPEGVITAADDMGQILDAAKEACELAREGLEPRVDLSRLRQEGAPIHGSGGTSSGPVSFLMEIFDNFLTWVNLGAETAGPVATLRYCYAPVLRVVRQGGTRRGAGMATLSIDHGDALDFLTAKDLDREAAEGVISTFNISFLVPDSFMESGSASAKELMEQVAAHAWATGEPGLIFVDRIHQNSALKNLPDYQIRCTNPCGEIPLTVGEPCDLGAMNLSAYVTAGRFDTGSFRQDVRDCVRFLDDVLDVNNFALPDNQSASRQLRRLGLGVMGLADALIQLGLRYDSSAGREAAREIMSALREEAVLASEELGRERGVYPLYAERQRDIPHPPRRNVAVLTVAPTGTTSMLMGVSSGIEPVFSPFVYRRIGSEYRALLHPLFVAMMEQFPPHPELAGPGGWDWDKVRALLETAQGSLQELPTIPAPIREVFVCAHDIAPADHVRMQGTIQRAFDQEGYAGNSLSKTINLPHSATEAEVLLAYRLAYQEGCKGITVYRDGSRQFQVLSTSKKEPEGAAPAPEAKTFPLPRPARLSGVTDMVKLTDAASGQKRSFLVTVNLQGDQPIEVIVTSGRAGDEANADSEALGRVVSIALQYGVPRDALVRTLRGINGGLYGSYGGRLVGSKADLVAVALETCQGEPGEARPAAQRSAAPNLEACPVCKEKALVREEGCVTCKSCGYSKCG